MYSSDLAHHRWVGLLLHNLGVKGVGGAKEVLEILKEVFLMQRQLERKFGACKKLEGELGKSTEIN